MSELSLPTAIPISLSHSDGFIYTLPPGLPVAPEAALQASMNQPALMQQLEKKPTLELMRRGQRFQQFIRSLDEKTCERRDIFLWFDPIELTKEGATTEGPGALYWHVGAEEARILNIHRCIPLQSIKEIFLGKITQNFKHPMAAEIPDELCCSLMAQATMIDLQAQTTEQLAAWLFGLCILMNGAGKKVLAAPEPLEGGNSSEGAEASEATGTNDSMEISQERPKRATHRFSIVNQNQAETPKKKKISLPSLLKTFFSPESSEPKNSGKLTKPFYAFRKSFKRFHYEFQHQIQEFYEEMMNSGEILLQNVQTFQGNQRAIRKALVEETGKRKKLQNQLIELQGNIRVYARIRPLNAAEAASGGTGDSSGSSGPAVLALNDESLILNSRVESNGGPVVSSKSFEFDRVYDGKSSQEEIFTDCAPFIQSCVDGYNVCIFAYGQTGSGNHKNNKLIQYSNPPIDIPFPPSFLYRFLGNSSFFPSFSLLGKSFTMEGPESNRGVNYRALQELFLLISKGNQLNHYHYTIYLSVVELYNESLRDLLDQQEAVKGTGQTGKLSIRQGPNGVFIPDLTEIPVNSVAAVQEIMKNRVFPNRKIGTTNMNEHSSRSHCLVFIRVVGIPTDPQQEEIHGKLILIDLAGSERLNRSGVSGVALKEAQAINQSLSALGNVISALQAKQAHIPYRSNPLTYLLQDCLSGNNKCLMICCLSPAVSSAQESLCSLQFASRARSTELGQAKKNTAVSLNSGIAAEAAKQKAAAKKFQADAEKRTAELIAAQKALKIKESEMIEKENAFAAVQAQLKGRDKEMAALKEKLAQLQSQQAQAAQEKVVKGKIDGKRAWENTNNAAPTKSPMKKRSRAAAESAPASCSTPMLSSSGPLQGVTEVFIYSDDEGAGDEGEENDENVDPAEETFLFVDGGTMKSRKTASADLTDSAAFAAALNRPRVKELTNAFESGRPIFGKLNNFPGNANSANIAAAAASTSSTARGQKRAAVELSKIPQPTQQTPSEEGNSTGEIGLSIAEAARKRLLDRKNKYKGSSLTASLSAAALPLAPQPIAVAAFPQAPATSRGGWRH